MILTKRKPTTVPAYLLAQSTRLILLTLVILAAIYGYNRFKLSHYFPIKTVQVFGVNRADHQEVRQLLLPLVDCGFFTVNVDYIRDRLLQMPWIANVYVRRNWPDQIKITVTEKNAVARWNDQGSNQALLSETGELFSPRLETYPLHLPLFKGPSGQQVTMLQYYLAMNRLLTMIHAKISILELSPYLTWKLKLDNGIVLEVGHQAVLKRLAEFVKVYPQIVGAHAKDVDYIDLRYANGVAVRWRDNGNLN